MIFYISKIVSRMIKPEEEVRVLLTKDLADKIRSLAEEHDVTVGSYIRDALHTHLKYQKKQTYQERKDSLKPIVISAVESSTSWDDLNEKLAPNNIKLYPKYKGISLFSTETNKFLATGASVGAPYKKLVLKFGSGHPDHKFPDIAENIINQSQKF